MAATFPFPETLKSGMPIGTLTADHINGLSHFANGMRGAQGITVTIEGGAPVIRMGDATFVLQTFWSCAPTFDESDNLTAISFQQVAGFVQIVGTASEVTVAECDCGA
jgi:hypothetical protein